jgi:hypothetical protein
MTYQPPGNDDPLGAVAGIKQEMFLMEQKLRRQVTYARECGASWSQIGNALGMTKQGAAKTYGRPRPAAPARDPLLPLFSSPQA